MDLDPYTPGGVVSPAPETSERHRALLIETSQPSTMDDFEWEERPEDVPFWRHAVAGSIAGVSEHIGMYPIDTLKTRMQAAKGEGRQGILNTARTIVREPTFTSNQARGVSAFYRGATAIAFGAVPAHIGLFGTYEYSKKYILTKDSNQPWRTAACGVAGSIVHDGFMVPMDVVKQRLQLGAYKGVGDCVISIVQREGLMGLYRSYAVTLMINAPYTGVLVGVNESLQLVLGFTPEQEFSVGWYFVFAGVGGVVAGILTLPLDVVKTRLQTQTVGLGDGSNSIKYKGIVDTSRQIMAESGPRGFAQGMVPRMIQAGPSAAICWGTYQGVQKLLTHSENAVTKIQTTADQILSDEAEDPFDWETWDPLEVPFWKHVVAGSSAGVMEHVAMYPVDTVKCRMQALQSPKSAALPGVRDTIRHILADGGVASLFRGCWVIGAGCIPAHVGLFGTYELSKKYLLKEKEHQPLRAAFCGAISTVVHDSIIVPMDVVKQRLQLGVYKSAFECVAHVSRTEGSMAFFRSLPATLIMECPFYAVLVAANESFKTHIQAEGRSALGWHFVTAGLSGILASAVTQPLDVIKTRLQTQEALLGNCTEGHVKYRGLIPTATSIWKEEGSRSFFRGTLPRMAFAAPSAAMCWGTYEVIKHSLVGV